MARAQPCDLGGDVRQQLEVCELEPGRHGAADECVHPPRAGRLPRPRRDDGDRLPAHRHRPDLHLADSPLLFPHQLERIAFVIVPHFVGSDAVPAAAFALGEEEVDGRQRGAGVTPLPAVHAVWRLEHLGKVAALRMRPEREDMDEVGGSLMHRAQQ